MWDSRFNQQVEKMRYELLSEIVEQRTHRDRNEHCRAMLIRFDMLIDEIKDRYTLKEEKIHENDGVNDDLPF